MAERRRPAGRAGPQPEFIELMAATLVGGPFDDPGWQYEIKWDGFRVEAVVRDGVVALWTRGRQDAARYFGAFLDPPTWLTARRAIVDGEVVALDDRGEPDFALLQSLIRDRGAPNPRGRLVYQVFDLLHVDGRSLLDEPLETRQTALADVIAADPRVRLGEHVVGGGTAFFAAARRRGLEGVMAKDRASRYEPGRRSDRWRKIKNRPEQELVVGGWAPGTGTAVDLGALLVGVHEGGRLRYAGKVGAGFTADKRAELLAALTPLARADPPFDPPPPRRLFAAAHWVEPRLVIRAEFAGWTGDGLVRQASYKGFDLGKDPAVVVREGPAEDASRA
jgi:bifunctional non-homologous end joining protein LigD